ncbi:hypothetical protein Krac_9873 [Ktedonobacter racemifer DSM 44963]|uniref:Uncharacterized protein n=1 Tax=Ktedonobacter racemifer DSM 44963 TaxID=485913 RepID=D6TE41_KTERA|nr:hypothetical protein Krac_9873 [Ktedonobacter racemifer DSM 44963]
MHTSIRFIRRFTCFRLLAFAASLLCADTSLQNNQNNQNNQNKLPSSKVALRHLRHRWETLSANLYHASLEKREPHTLLD